MKRNVLIIAPFNPFPLISGGHQAVFNGVTILKDVANVFLMVKTTESQYKKGCLNDLKNVLEFVKIIPYIDPASKHNFRWYYNVIMNKLYKKRISVKSSHKNDTIIDPVWEISNDKKKFVEKIINKYKIDIVQIEMMEDISLVKYLPQNVKKIFVHHELKYVKDKLLLESCKHSNIEDDLWRKNKFIEIELLNKFDYVITLSSIDSEKLKEEKVTTEIITSLATVKENQLEIPQQPIRKVLSYLGPEFHYPNYEGVMCFLDNCWTQILAKDKDYSLQIIGKWSSTTINLIEKKYKNVKCVGFVNDLVQTLSGTTMIVPLNIGSGIRMKILEAAQYNVPVVTTSVGVEGLPLVNGVHLFVADTSEDFIESILRLQNNELREKFIDATKNVIKYNYSVNKLKESREFLYT